MNNRGLGNCDGDIQVYIENTPPLPEYRQLSVCRGVTNAEIHSIGLQAGNGWRKVFNVYAKFIFELGIKEAKSFTKWQTYRDQHLLHEHSTTCLWMSLNAEQLLPNLLSKNSAIHIVMGKGYANRLLIDGNCFWLTPDFAYNVSKRLIICPYFDYRQLSNEKITYLCKLVNNINNNQRA